MVLLFTVASCTKDEDPVVEEASYTIDLNLAKETNWEMADEILVLVNEHRATLGLSAIVRDQQYASAFAVEHTKYMIEMSTINHDNFAVRSKALKDRGAESVGENVAKSYTSAQHVVTAWLNSPSHKQVIEGNYTHSGFGIIPDARGNIYFTQLFYRK